MDERLGVSEIMTTAVVSTRAEATLLEAAQLMRQHHVSGLPVVDEGSVVVGVLSEVDLVRGLHHATGVMSPRGILDLLLESVPAKGPGILEVCQSRLRNGHVADLMTARPTTIEPDATIREAARLIHQNHISRLPVVDERRKLVGIVTRIDLLGAIAGAMKGPRGALHPTLRAAKVRREHPTPVSKGRGAASAFDAAAEQRVYGGA